MNDGNFVADRRSLHEWNNTVEPQVGSPVSTAGKPSAGSIDGSNKNLLSMAHMTLSFMESRRNSMMSWVSMGNAPFPNSQISFTKDGSRSDSLHGFPCLWNDIGNDEPLDFNYLEDCFDNCVKDRAHGKRQLGLVDFDISSSKRARRMSIRRVSLVLGNSFLGFNAVNDGSKFGQKQNNPFSFDGGQKLFQASERFERAPEGKVEPISDTFSDVAGDLDMKALACLSLDILMKAEAKKFGCLAGHCAKNLLTAFSISDLLCIMAETGVFKVINAEMMGKLGKTECGIESNDVKNLPGFILPGMQEQKFVPGADINREVVELSVNRFNILSFLNIKELPDVTKFVIVCFVLPKLKEIGALGAYRSQADRERQTRDVWFRIPSMDSKSEEGSGRLFKICRTKSVPVQIAVYSQRIL